MAIATAGGIGPPYRTTGLWARPRASSGRSQNNAPIGFDVIEKVGLQDDLHDRVVDVDSEWSVGSVGPRWPRELPILTTGVPPPRPHMTRLPRSSRTNALYTIGTIYAECLLRMREGRQL
jgi:hypothetical protein